VFTSDKPGASTDAAVGIKLHGDQGASTKMALDRAAASAADKLSAGKAGADAAAAGPGTAGGLTHLSNSLYLFARSAPSPGPGPAHLD
jgi:hypothetical protein